MRPQLSRLSLLVFSVLLLHGCASGPRPGKSPNTRATAATVEIHQIQGADHRSPWDGHWVSVAGVVTAVAPKDQRVFIQSETPDDDPKTSEGLCVQVEDPSRHAVGERVRWLGQVEEIAQPGSLPLTCLRADSFDVSAENVPLPEAVTVGSRGRAVPADHVDDDGLARFEPEDDALDFFESLEGMRLRVPEPVVVGAASSYGEVVVLGDRGQIEGPRTNRGGLLQSNDDPHTERWILTGDAGQAPGELHVGDRLSGDAVGVLGYGYGGYRLQLTEPLGRVEYRSRSRDHEVLTRRHDAELTVATFNLKNLAATDPKPRFERLAAVIVQGMDSPDLIAVQEVQDDSGREDDGTVNARKSFRKLIRSIRSRGGPTYKVRSIDPVDNKDGGAPGGNIRVGYLYNPERLEAPGPLRRLHHSAFDADTETGWRNTRRPLIDRFSFRGREITVINVHLRSKGADDRRLGARQPPVRHSEAQRTAQAEAIREWIDDHWDKHPDANIMVLGDFNERPGRPPMLALTESEDSDRKLLNLLDQVPEASRFTYVYQGESGVLDHILASRRLMIRPRASAIHCCSQTPAKQQPSDHDPILATFLLP